LKPRRVDQEVPLQGNWAYRSEGRRTAKGGRTKKRSEGRVFSPLKKVFPPGKEIREKDTTRKNRGGGPLKTLSRGGKLLFRTRAQCNKKWGH